MATSPQDWARFTANPEQALDSFQALDPFLSKAKLSSKETQALLDVLGNSSFLARWAQRHPESVAEIFQDGLKQALDLTSYQKILKTKDFLKLDRDKLATALLDLKYRHLFRITLRDLGKMAPLKEIVAEFSDLSQFIVQTALHWHLNELESQQGIPVEGKRHSKIIPYTVMAMGKLGGRELNFSSDIDVIYYYGSDQGTLSPHQYFTQLSQKLTQFLSQKIAGGFLYRVDLDLRPEGKSGAMVNSLDAMEDYYEYFGADWERQALIKAAYTAGDPGLFQEFLFRVHPFVYTKITDYSFLTSLKRMKEKIVDSIRQSGKTSFHVKLGDGGIREIEFFVQSLQLLFGGNHPSLQTPNTLEALEKLQEAKIIGKKDQHALEEAYVFLRTMEHRLQLAEEQQTHLLPDSEEELDALARRMGYHEPNIRAAKDRMLADLEVHRRHVQRMFGEIFSQHTPRESPRRDQALKRKLVGVADLENRLDALRVYKSEEMAKIRNAFLANPNPPAAMNALTDLAEEILITVYEMARAELERLHGHPQEEGSSHRGEFAVVGMGKFGGRELHFHSDLDLIFVFSRQGKTTGPKILTHQEYFAKLAQKIMNYLILPTAKGYLYKADTELRPSGNAGALVTSLEAWISYYQEHAALWERQALLKARELFSSGGFFQDFEGLFPRLIFNKPFPESLGRDIDYLRRRIETELAKEGDRRWNYKKGYGGLVDIEFIVQFLQLRYGREFPEVVEPNTLKAMELLKGRQILSEAFYRILHKAYYFYRTLEIYLEILFDLKEGTLDLDHECLPELAEKMSFPKGGDLIQTFKDYRHDVRRIYKNVLQV